MKPTHIHAPRSLRDAHIDGDMAGLEGPYTADGTMLTPRRLALWIALLVAAFLPLALVLGAR